MKGVRGPEEPKEKNLEPTLLRARGEAARFHGAQPTKDELIGRTIGGRYKINELIGEGGMGKVYQAEDMRIGKKVAVKVLPEYLAKTPNIVERFIQEALIAPRIDHENIIDVTDKGKTSQGVPYFVMEFLKGSDLAGVIRSGGPMPWCQRTKDLMTQICRGLAAAHAKDIVHRDMKPENVFIVERSDGSAFIKLFDFGIAKLVQSAREENPDDLGDLFPAGKTQAGTVMGTPQYMAPEQARGEEVDSLADVYAAGTIFYEMLCGRTPFVVAPDESPSDDPLKLRERRMAEVFRLLDMQKNLAPTPPRILRPDLAIPPEIEAIILRALAKEKGERVQSMKELEEAIECIKAPEAIPLTSRVEASAAGLRFGSRSMMGHMAIKDEEARRRRRALRIAAVIAAAAVIGAAGGADAIYRYYDAHHGAHTGVVKDVDTQVDRIRKK